MKRKYRIHLTEEQRDRLEALTRKGRIDARTMKRAQILLLADESQGTSKTNKEICEILGVSWNMPTRICRRFAASGMDAAIGEAPRPGGKPKLSGKDEALIGVHGTLSCAQSEICKLKIAAL